MRQFIAMDLLEKFLKGTCTFSEKELVHRWYALYENEPVLFKDERNNRALKMKETSKVFVKARLRECMQIAAIVTRGEQKGILKMSSLSGVRTAVFILLTTGIFTYFSHSIKQKKLPDLFSNHTKK